MQEEKILKIKFEEPTIKRELLLWKEKVYKEIVNFLISHYINAIQDFDKQWSDRISLMISSLDVSKQNREKSKAETPVWETLWKLDEILTE